MKTIHTQLALALLATVMTAASAQAVDLAKVNGRAVTDADVRAALSSLSDAQRQNVLKDTATRRQVLSSIIDQELLVQEGEKAKLDQDKEYKDALNAFRRQFLTARVLQKNLGSKMDDKAAKKFYEQNKQRYSTEQVHAMHVLVKDENQAKELAKQLKGADKEKFAEVAEKTSIDPSAKNNRGDLGFFGRDRMVAEFSEAAFGAGTGEVVGPVKTSFGYHVIKVLEKRSGKPMQYDEVELRVKNDLRQELTHGYVANLKKTAKVEVDEKAIDKL